MDERNFEASEMAETYLEHSEIFLKIAEVDKTDLKFEILHLSFRKDSK